jgi:PHS family inorganic phosphate transporter-like MFS transporter
MEAPRETVEMTADPFNHQSRAEEAREFRHQALSKIDNASFGLQHIRAVIVAGVGFFTDSYDIFAINLAVGMLGVVYWQGEHKGKIPSASDTAIKVSTSGGTVIGQLFFGWLADRIGRKRMYGIELMIIIMATLAQALSSASVAVSITGLLVFWRVIMGIGIGGDYPLSSVITSEYVVRCPTRRRETDGLNRFATTKWRGAMMAAVFAMQGFGQFAAAIIALIVTTGFKESLESAKDVGHCTGACQQAVDKMWRVIIGFGAVPACFALYYRLTIPETPRFTFDVKYDLAKADGDVNAYLTSRSEIHPDEIDRSRILHGHTFAPPQLGWRGFVDHFSQWEHGKVLLGTAGSWFFLDVGKVDTMVIDFTHTNALSLLRSGSQQLHHSLCYRLDWRQKCL